MPARDEFRLPRTVVPARYELTIEPDLDAATFAGDCTAEVEVIEPTDEIVLNAADLHIESAWIEGAGPARPRIPAEVRLEPETERARLLLPESLHAGGWYVVTRFSGELNDRLQGFYRSSFTEPDGSSKLIATTQMEATHARRAFPCWDEPDLKAVFATTLVVPENLLAVSNTAELGRTPTGDGKVAVRFADTMPIPTYLVAFVVGPLVASPPVEVRNVPIRVIHRPGKERLVSFALEVASFSLSYFEDYYGIAYPGDKLDLVAIPDFAFGAMENMGCVTFREVLLLADPATVTQPELQNVTDVISHELAHMWFGNLVTMRWWNGIWLNEAFATFMELRCTDAFRPEWRRWVSFSTSRSSALDVDALASTRPVEYEVESPEDAEGMFDVLTYEKGASVVRMLEQFVGEEPFRAGIRDYLQKHQFGNTETTDLWDSIERVTGEPARRIMDAWILQGGYPLVLVERTEAGVRLRQERFMYRSDPIPSSWPVPLLIRTSTSGEETAHRILLGDAPLELELGEWIHVNAGAHGFYRVRYEPALLQRIVDRAQQLLDAAERFALVDDGWAAVLAGHDRAASFLSVTETFSDEADLSVWQRIIASLSELDRLVDGEPRRELQRRVRELLVPARQRLEQQETLDERGRQLRATLFEASAVLGDDPAARQEAAELWNRYLDDPTSVDPAMAAAAIPVLAVTGGPGEFELFWERSKSAQNPQEELRFLGALADFRDSTLLQRFLDMTITDAIRTQNAPYLIRRALANRDLGPLTWQFMSRNWEVVCSRFPSSSIPRMLEGVRSLSWASVADEVFSFFEQHEVPQGRLQVAQHLERLRVNVDLREREAPQLAAALTA